MELWTCSKCGAIMQIKTFIGHIYWPVCPNGCKQDYENIRTTASAMSAEEDVKAKESNNAS